MSAYLSFFTLVLTPLILGSGLSIGFRKLEKRRQGRTPSDEKLLRPAGESLRKKLTELEEETDSSLVILVAAPGMIFGAFCTIKGATSALSTSDWVQMWVMATTLTVWTTIGLVKTLRCRADYRLGYSGERAVGERLNRLQRHGLEVFHDCPADKLGNIDHIVIGPKTVWAIETKARRKRRSAADQPDHEVVYDGEALLFPHGRETGCVDQTRRQAAWLANLLSEALAEPVEVKPLLVLPGWMVKRVGRGDVTVVNPKELDKLLQVQVPPESRRRIQQLAFVLDQRCRDVEF